MHSVVHDKSKNPSFIITYTDSKKDKRDIKKYRFSIESGNVKKEDLNYFRRLFFTVPIFNTDIEELCDLLNEKTKNYLGKKVTVLLMVTSKHTFKFEILDSLDKPIRVSMSLSEDEYNQLTNIHADSTNNTLSNTLKDIYLLGIEKVDEDSEKKNSQDDFTKKIALHMKRSNHKFDSRGILKRKKSTSIRKKSDRA